MVNGLHLYSAFIQSALQFLPLIHPFTHTFTHQRRLAAMQGTNQLVRSNRGLGVSLRDTSTRPGWDRTGNPPTARRQLYLLSHIAPQCFVCFLKTEGRKKKMHCVVEWVHCLHLLSISWLDGISALAAHLWCLHLWLHCKSPRKGVSEISLK